MSSASSSKSTQKIMDLMGINIYAVKSSGEVSILHDKEFPKKLASLEYNQEKNELLFVFTDHSQMPYGETIKKELGEFLATVETVSCFQIDMDSKKPVAGFKVPIKTVTYL